jgi:hypothetical protein
MALSDEEKATLESLQRKATEPDKDFDVEIWDDSGRGAKVPYSKGRSWLQKTFGIDLDPEPTPDDKSGDGDKNVTHAQKYFGSKKAS